MTKVFTSTILVFLVGLMVPCTCWSGFLDQETEGGLGGKKVINFKLICYASDFTPIYLPMKKSDCVYNSNLSTIISGKQRLDYLTIRKLIKNEIEVQDCREAKYCYSCCMQGFCQDKQTCDIQWGYASNYGLMALIGLSLSQIMVLYYLVGCVFCNLGRREKMLDMLESLDEDMREQQRYTMVE